MKTLQSLLLSLLPTLTAAQQHYLLLEITFDSNPTQTSWKFSNSRSTTELDSRTFNYYGNDLAGSTVKERLEILGEEDLGDDPLDVDVVREYSFVIYDQGGDGLCCSAGEGSYSVYNKGELLFVGNAFGTSEEHSIRIDPKDFIQTESTTSSSSGSNANSGGTGSNTNEAGSGNGSLASFNTPTTPPPTVVTDAPIPSRPTVSPAPTAKPISPTAQLAVDQERWYCGSSWEWIIRNCAEATPCPGGDASVCPENFACFASTPCTPEPTDAPSDSPSMMPSVEPTETPTKSPWSETAFVTFLYGDNASSGGTGDGQSSSSGGNSGNDEVLASEVNNALENSSSLQFHFFCGYSWSHADETCNKFCPTGDRAECPDGMDCFANTQCDGRDTPPPTESPAPSSSAPVSSVNINIGSGGSGGVSSGGSDTDSGLCTLCTENQLDTTKSITINGKDVTCGSVENMFTYENILTGSDNCNAVQKMYQDICCYDVCQLCELPSGEFLDVQDVLLEKGGYKATCSEVNNILSANPKNDKMCFDAKEQLAGDCCYKQCTLCDDEEGETTSWYATISFEGIQSTCLGLDFMLRTEQVGSGSDRCSSTRSAYSEQCCYIPPTNPCQLCEADGTVYGLNSAKSVSTVERQSTTSCAWINDDLAKISSDQQQCKEGKGAYFGQCCDLTGVIGTSREEGGEGGKGAGGGASDSGNGSGGDAAQGVGNAENATTAEPQDSYWSSGGSEWNPEEWNPPSSGISINTLFTGGIVSLCYLCVYCLFMFH